MNRPGLAIHPSLLDWLKRRRDEFDGLLLDIDGVLARKGKRLAGARRLLRWLEETGLAWLLLTNDGNRSPEEKATGLGRVGLAIPPKAIVSCGHGFVDLVAQRGWQGRLFFAIGDTGRPCYAQAAGLQVTRDEADIHRCQGVIVGEENYDWEQGINAAVNFFVQRPDAPLVVPNPDDFYPSRTRTIHVGSGAIARMMARVLEGYGIGVEPIFLGKPYRAIFDHAHRRLQAAWGRRVDPQRLLMVGDNPAADVAGARNFGCRSALLLTGVCRRHHLPGLDLPPDHIFEAIVPC